MVKNLTYIIQNFRISSGIVNTQYDQQLLQFAINGMRKLRDLGQVKEVVKAVELTVTDNVANLPPDFISMIRIGLCKCGTLVQIDMCDDLCLPKQNAKDCACDSDTNDCANNNNGEDLSSWIFPLYGQPYSFSYTVGSYAIPPVDYRGGYKIDYYNRQIIFDGHFDTVILEYFGDFLDDAGNCLIEEKYIEVLTLWLDYERKYWSPDGQYRREAPAARVRWYQAVRDLNSTNQSMNKHNWLILFRSFMFQGVKV